MNSTDADGIDGILLLDKPVGLSSNAALQQVRRLFDGAKAGHTGSLDPLASGMLPICVGEATKLAGELLAGRKAYRFTLRLGERTSTGDAEGEVAESAPVPPLDAARVEAVLAGFRGESRQVPPMYSALKRDGQPLYRLARQGVVVEREARTIDIGLLRLEGIAGAQMDITVHCSKGTYVRVLGEDLARALGSCGHLRALRREYVEPFAEQPLWTLAALAAADAMQRAAALLPADSAVPQLPALALDEDAATQLRYGRTLPAAVAGAGQWRLYDAQRRFIGLGTSTAGGELRVRRLFCRALPALWAPQAPLGAP